MVLIAAFITTYLDNAWSLEEYLSWEVLEDDIAEELTGTDNVGRVGVSQ